MRVRLRGGQGALRALPFLPHTCHRPQRACGSSLTHWVFMDSRAPARYRTLWPLHACVGDAQFCAWGYGSGPHIAAQASCGNTLNTG